MSAVKIALIGSAPSSVGLAPYGNPEWVIFGCSPGVYPIARKVHVWIELHRWEPGQVGVPESQKPWFTPEYVQWMAQQPLVWMREAVPEIPNSRALPVADLLAKWGTNWFTSSLAYMMAMSIDEILKVRESRAAGKEDALQPGENDTIALFGVDMAAQDEYGYQRAGCQYFIQIADALGINVVVPPESDLLRPMPLYGISESSHWMIKMTARKRELENRLNGCRQAMANASREEQFLLGALDDMNYQMLTWCEDRSMQGPSPEILAKIASTAYSKLMPPGAKAA